MPIWTWDPTRDALNRRAHNGLSLAAGTPVIEGDPFAVSRPDPHPDGDRWQTVGLADGTVLLFVVHTEPVDLSDGEQQGRIISVRKATSRERRAFGMATSKVQTLSADLRAQLQAAADLPDELINTADPDAPEVTDWSGAVRGRFYRPIKRQKTLRIDADVLAWFEQQGPGHLTRMNQVLRTEMLRGLQAARQKEDTRSPDPAGAVSNVPTAPRQ